MNTHGNEIGSHRLRVRYCETDRMGVAHHGSYIAWFEEARTEWLRARGKSYRELEDEGTLLQVTELNVRYVSSTTYDDELIITTRELERGKASITLGYTVTRAGAGTLVATGTTKLACVDRSGKVRRLPPSI